jgi:hypothetical protein
MFRIALPLALTLALGATGAHAAAQLELSLAAPKASFILGEPVAVLARLANTGDEPAQAPRHLRPEYGAVTYNIAGPVTRSYAPWALKEPAEPYGPLAPGEVLEQSVDLFFAADGWVFLEPGTYEITATMAGVAPSAPLSISVTEPQGEAESNAAAQLLASDEAGRFLLLRGGDHLKDGIAVLEDIAQDQADSSLAAYANLALGLNQLAPARDFAAGTVRPADPQAAADRLDLVQDQPLSLAATVEAKLGLAAALDAMGQASQATEIEQQLPQVVIERFPEADAEVLRDVTIPTMRQQFQR